MPAKYREVGITGKDTVDVIDRAIHYMHDNLQRKLNVQDIAHYLHLSPSHFSSIFHKRTGFPPIDYFTRLKVQKACEYLDLHGMKINQICPLIGYEDPLYFSRVFTKIMGMSPSRFKNRGMAEDTSVE